MTRGEIERLVEDARIGWRTRDADLLVARCAEDCVVESPVHGLIKGRARIAEIFRAWFSAFPDVQFEATDLVAEDDRAVMFWTVTGTHNAEFSGFPATGRAFQIRGASLYTFSHTQIVHERRLYDFTALLMQIGVLKAKPAP
jgi:steroid delta-isomerase-like uncharacterized protein